MTPRPRGVEFPAMLTHPEWADTVVLAPPSGTGTRLITGIAVVPDLTGRPEALDGRLLTVAITADRADWRLDTLIQLAVTAGAGALLLPGVEPLRRASLALALRLGLPVLGCTTPLDAALALRSLIAEGDRRAAELVLRTAEVCRNAGARIDDLVRDLGALFRRPTALLDAGGVVAGSAVVSSGDSGVVAKALLPRSAPGPVVLTLPEGGELVAHPVATTQAAAPIWLAVRLPSRLPAETAALTQALLVATAGVSQRLAVRRLSVERDARARASLLGELLHAAGEPSTGTRRRSLDAGWRLEGWHIGIRLDAGRDVDTVALRADVVAALQEQGLDAVVVEHGDGWSSWTTLSEEPTAAAVEAHSAAVRRAQHELSEAVRLSVGVGRTHAGPAGIGRTLAEATDAARLAANRSASGYFVHIDRLGLAQLLLAWTRTDTFHPAARSLLAPLTGQPGDLLRTLSAYLDAESSLSETAAVLGIHRNTVAARIARVQELLNVELADAEERLALHLACRTILTADERSAPSPG